MANIIRRQVLIPGVHPQTNSKSLGRMQGSPWPKWTGGWGAVQNSAPGRSGGGIQHIQCLGGLKNRESRSGRQKRAREVSKHTDCYKKSSIFPKKSNKICSTFGPEKIEKFQNLRKLSKKINFSAQKLSFFSKSHFPLRPVIPPCCTPVPHVEYIDISGGGRRFAI